MVKIGSEPDEIHFKEMQVCTEIQRRMFISQDDKLDIWADKIDNLNNVSTMR